MASAAMPAVRAGSNLSRRTNNAKKQARTSVIRAASTTKAKTIEVPPNLERHRILTPWEEAQPVLKSEFGMSDSDIAEAGALSDEEISEAYTMMQLCRDFENECNQAYMAGKIRGFMHLDNGQESIPRCSATPSARPTSSTRTTAITATRSRAASTPVRHHG
jgi:pyruvate dehydrogenase E1 component alpha subunit